MPNTDSKTEGDAPPRTRGQLQLEHDHLQRQITSLKVRQVSDQRPIDPSDTARRKGADDRVQELLALEARLAELEEFLLPPPPAP
jgi:hypothetical protein